MNRELIEDNRRILVVKEGDIIMWNSDHKVSITAVA
tara:strand:- start:4270 stop:4377 length:108 start_codon:yes stop_codon:yes gene_type:complete